MNWSVEAFVVKNQLLVNCLLHELWQQVLLVFFKHFGQLRVVHSHHSGPCLFMAVDGGFGLVVALVHQQIHVSDASLFVHYLWQVVVVASALLYNSSSGHEQQAVEQLRLAQGSNLLLWLEQFFFESLILKQLFQLLLGKKPCLTLTGHYSERFLMAGS